MAGELAGIATNKRVTVRRDGEPDGEGKCVVYWLQKAQRAIDNPALETAIACGNALGLPVVAYFSVIPNYPHANWRHYHFLQQGLPDIHEGMKDRGVGFCGAAANRRRYPGGFPRRSWGGHGDRR